MQALKQILIVCVASVTMVGPYTAFAQSNMDHSNMEHGKPESSQTVPSMSDGEVRKVDMETGKVTIRHGYIKHLDMPSMAMVFTVKDKGLLTDLKSGDKIQFLVVNEAGKLVITAIKPTQ